MGSRTIARLVTTTAVLLAGITVTAGSSSVTATAGPSDQDWLGIVNTYRAMSGLSPVTANASWSDGAVKHSCYMLFNGISHDEIPGMPGYTVEGRAAGLNGNVAVSSSVSATPRSHIDLWMTGPFHAIGVLRHNLAQTGFGLCANENTSPWRSGATLDVLRGINSSIPRPSQPIVFPGREATIPLTRFVAETPNPISLCGWTGAAGLPLIAMMPAGVSSASSSLTGPSGPVATCTLHPGNTSDPTAQGIMRSENAVVVVPRVSLESGRYTATVSSNGGNVTWSFNVDPQAPLTASLSPLAPAPAKIEVITTKPTSKASSFEPITPYRHADSRKGIKLVRLRAGQPRRVEIAGSDVTAVSANFTVAEQANRGHLRVYNCTSGVPTISTVNFTWSPAANQAVVPLSNGGLCLYSSADTHVVIDVNGVFRAGSSATNFTPLPPKRIFDSRKSTTPKLAANEKRTIRVAGVAGGAPKGASAVAVNLTAVKPSAQGFIRAFPCDQTKRSDVSNVNFAPGETRPNSAIIPVSAAGTICIESKVATDLILDINGYFSTDAPYQFTPLNLVRLLDTRSTVTSLNPVTKGQRLGSGQIAKIKVAGARGVPADAKAVSINLTATDALVDGYVTAFPCGALPDVSTLNAGPARHAVANGAMVGLSGAGELCVYSARPTHLVIDISGIWS
jgi:hypothetical protein